MAKLTDRHTYIDYFGNDLVQTYLWEPKDDEPDAYRVYAGLQFGRIFCYQPLCQVDHQEQAEQICNNLNNAWKRIAKREENTHADTSL